jgi:hypothetical protein
MAIPLDSICSVTFVIQSLEPLRHTRFVSSTRDPTILTKYKMPHLITLTFAIAGGVPLASFGIQTAHAKSGTFNLFGYGPGIGGFPVIEIDGQ